MDRFRLELFGTTMIAAIAAPLTAAIGLVTAYLLTATISGARTP